MGKKVSGGGRTTSVGTTSASTAAAASEKRDVLERQVRVRTQTTQVAFNVWAETGSREARRRYQQELRNRNRTIDKYEKAVARSKLLNGIR